MRGFLLLLFFAAAAAAAARRQGPPQQWLGSPSPRSPPPSGAPQDAEAWLVQGWWPREGAAAAVEGERHDNAAAAADRGALPPDSVLQDLRDGDPAFSDAMASVLLRQQQQQQQADAAAAERQRQQRLGILDVLRAWQTAEKEATALQQQQRVQQQQQQQQSLAAAPLLLPGVFDAWIEGASKSLLPPFPSSPFSSSSSSSSTTTTTTARPTTAAAAAAHEEEDPSSAAASAAAARAAAAAGLETVAAAAAAGREELLAAAAAAAAKVSPEGSGKLLNVLTRALGPPVVLQMEALGGTAVLSQEGGSSPPRLLLEGVRDQTSSSMHFSVRAAAAEGGQRFLMRVEKAATPVGDERFAAAAERQKSVLTGIGLLQSALHPTAAPQQQQEGGDADALRAAREYLLLPLWVGQLSLSSPILAETNEEALLNWTEVYSQVSMRLQQLPPLQQRAQWFAALQALKAAAALQAAGLHLSAFGPAAPWISSEGSLLLEGVHTLQLQQQQQQKCQDEGFEKQWKTYLPPEKAFCGPSVPPEDLKLWQQQQQQRSGPAAAAATAWGLGLLLFHIFCSARLPYGLAAVGSERDTLQQLRRLYLAAVDSSSSSSRRKLNLKTCGSDPRAHRLLKALLHPNPDRRASPTLLLQQLLQEEHILNLASSCSRSCSYCSSHSFKGSSSWSKAAAAVLQQQQQQISFSIPPVVF
ncbi:hypothetical protein Esti_001155 [Eimeria stiedai]